MAKVKIIQFNQILAKHDSSKGIEEQIKSTLKEIYSNKVLGTYERKGETFYIVEE